MAGNLDAAGLLLALESKWFRYAFKYDSVLGMSVSKVDPLPHQMEAVYGHLMKKSRIRFMLAHDPGAGKTIMAGLVIKELVLRNEIRRVLIVVPGQLKEQWRWELHDKFDEDFTVVDREYYEENKKHGAWGGDRLITSMDFAKREDILKSLDGVEAFDLVIVDEAHKMSAYSSGSSTTKTRRYRLGEALSSNTNHLLFLTATPHKGDSQNFRLLLDLLEPGYLATDDLIASAIQKRDNPLFLRRAKEDMVDFDGMPLFVPRTVETPALHLSRKEKTLYNAMSRYVKEQYNLASQSATGHNITFALIILQRRFASSTFALHESLKRRRAKLAHLERAPEKAAEALESMEKVEELTESERWDEEAKWELLSMARTREELREEIGAIDGLIAKAAKILESGKETKIVQLKNTIDELERNDPGEKMLIFTESRDTMNHLVKHIRSWGYRVNTIHGAMPPKVRKAAETEFRDRTQIMVATEAAGEGINLQFCHLMINYDLPWNPNRLEQRMGRIHRYGQKHPVSVFNMVAIDTREGEIMQRLFEKLEEIKAAMGSDKIFDVIGEVISGKGLSQMLLDATVRSKRQAEIIKDLDRSVSVDNSAITRYMKDSLASKYIDYTPVKRMREDARAGRLMPEYTRDLFQRILDAAGGSVDWRGELATVTMPPEMTGDGVSGVYSAATFDKKVRMGSPGADLITFGHPAFDASLDWAEDRYSGAAMSGASFRDESGRMDGHLVFTEGSVYDGDRRRVGRQLFACFVDGDKNVVPVSPAVVLDIVPYPGGASGGGERAKKLAVSESVRMLKDFMGRLGAERESEAEADTTYGLRSLDELIRNINASIIDMLSKKRQGKKMDLPIYNKRQDRSKYKRERLALTARIKNKTALSAGDITVVGLARVHADPGNAGELKSAVVAAAKFEKKCRRMPEIVSGRGFGFDIRSIDPQGVPRYILVKPVRPDRPVAFTPNEWLRSKILGYDCCLYAVVDGETLLVRDPANELRPDATESGCEVDVEQIEALATVP